MPVRGRILAALTAVTCVLGTGVTVPAQAAIDAKIPKPSPGTAVSGVRATKYRFTTPRDDAKDSFRAPVARWPTARTAAVGLLDDSGKPAGKVEATGTPVWAKAASAAAPARAELQVLDQQAAKRAGVSGVLVKVTPQGTGSGSIRVGVDYADFAEAYGGNYGSRLRLVELPTCALTTPELAACQRRTPLRSSNDGQAQEVSAEVSPAAPVLLAATASAASTSATGGTYAATDLKPSGSWTGGGNSGSFTYSYPIALPPAAGGSAPSFGLSYNSSGVDGQTVATQAQASWAGDGWSTPRSFIEQSFTSCANQPEGKDAPKETLDLCYDGPVLLMSLNGSTSALVYDKDKDVWKAESDNGEVITHDLDKSATPKSDNGTWTVTTRDGTAYHFGLDQLPGWTSGKATTNSVDTVPVYSAHAGDPCYSESGWKASVCDMAWRWNLDYVTDAHGNAISYYYKQNTNYYGRNLGDEDVTYVRESYLDHVDYGFRAGDAYGTVPNKIALNTSDRCADTCQAPGAAASAKNWPDVPFDLICDKGKNCDNWSPAFFSTVRLASIVTKQYSTSAGGYVPVDTTVLTHTTPKTGDGTSPTLWLSDITRTGHDTTGSGSTSSITLPSVSFTGVKLPNRARVHDGLPAFYRQRIGSITTETGSVIAVAYELPQACGEVTPKSNTDSCYPVYWTPDGYTEPTLDWFNKYAVTRVTQTDPTGGAPATATSYAYVGGAAWHYDDTETVKKKYRSYGQFRGYAKVQTFTGDGVNDRRAKAESTFYRGMSKNNSDTVLKVPDSLGGAHEDLDDLAGSVLESTTYRGEGGVVDNSTINAYWVSAATGTRSRDGLDPLTANWVANATTVTRQRVIGSDGATSSWLYNEVDNSYDADVGSATVGVLQTSYSHTVPAKADFDRCTTSTYARTSAASPIVGLVSQAETVSVACGGFIQGSPASVPAELNSLTAPSSVSRPAQVVARKRMFYDDEKWSTTFPQPDVPTRGDVTMSQTADGYSAGAYTYTTTARSSYDEYGRVEGVYDGNNNLTKTEYSMNSVGLTTGTTVKAPLGHTTSTTVSPLRGLTLTSTDVNNVVSTSRYDALGRTTAVWLNNRATSAPANLKFSYTVSKTGVTAATTETANDANGYIKSITLYDALLRVRQTQTVTAQSGRLVTDNFYDTRGWLLYTYNGWWDSATTPSVGAPVTAADLKVKVPSQTFNTYDGLGRAVVVEQAKNNTTVSKTTAVYQGDRTTVFPPDGDTVTSTLADPIGRTTSLTEYKVRPRVVAPSDTFTGFYGLDLPISTTGAAFITTSYGYDGQGNQNKVTDAKNNAWTSTYNLLGQVTAKSDPDAGTTTDMTYDGNGNLLQATDGRGKTISTRYDELNRITATYDGAISAQSAPSNRLTAQVYDNSDGAVANMTFPKGHLTTATSFSGGQAYVRQARGFTVFGGSIGETTKIPTSEGALAGDYTVAHTYTINNGLPLKDTYPAKATLPSETVLYSYDGFDTLEGVGGAAGYLESVTQDAYGRINQLAIGSGTKQAYVTDSWDEHTGLLNQQLVTRKLTTPANVDQQNYTYDLAGNLTKQTSQRLATGVGETQCYDYDELRRLTEAWTATDDCATAPTAGAHTMVGNTIGSGSAYWTGWAFDDLGNRTSQTQHTITGTTDTVTSHTYATSGQAHALTSTTTTGATTGSTSYTYDAAGHTKTRNTGTGTQTLDWDVAGKLASVTTTSGTTSNIYGPDGGLLVEKTPGSTTLYLGSQQFALNTSTNVVSGTRYYALPGGSAIRTGTGTNYSFTLSDRHGTPMLYLDSTAQKPSWRQYTAYGEDRGVGIALPDNRAFLNKTLNANTGLIQMGARQYDATIGRFISVDPLQILTDPQQWNGYAYSNNNPVVYSDPTGLAGDTGNGSGNGVRFNPVNGDVLGGGTGNVYDGTDESDDFTNGSDGVDTGGGTSGTVDIAKIVNKPVVIPDGLKDALKDWDYGSDVYTMARLSAFAAQGDRYWELICVWLAADVTQCGGGTINPFVKGNGWKDWVVGGLVVGALVGSLVCAEAAPVCFAIAAEYVAGEAAFAATGSGLGAASFGFWGASKLAGVACSFSQDTKVLMSDRSAKRFEDVQAGDTVMAADPQNGEPVPKLVEAVWVHDDDLYVLTVDGQHLVTTEDHPYWNVTDQAWEDAQDLDVGDLLSTPTGTARVDEFDMASNRKAPAYNLTVADLHTYYVLAGNTPVLVHNCGILPESKAIADHANKRFMDPAGFEHYVAGVDPKALDAYVDGVLEGSVPNVSTRYLNRGRVAHWDPDKSAVVIEDGAGGTVFTPRDGRTYFDDLK